MNYGKTFRSLCTPAQVYFVLSLSGILMLLAQNGDSHRYCVGKHKVDLPFHNASFFIFKALYVLFWTYILQSLCKHGYANISWFVVLLPFLGLGLIMALFLLTHM